MQPELLWPLQLMSVERWPMTRYSHSAFQSIPVCCVVFATHKRNYNRLFPSRSCAPRYLVCTSLSFQILASLRILSLRCCVRLHSTENVFTDLRVHFEGIALTLLLFPSPHHVLSQIDELIIHVLKKLTRIFHSVSRAMWSVLSCSLSLRNPLALSPGV